MCDENILRYGHPMPGPGLARRQIMNLIKIVGSGILSLSVFGCAHNTVSPEALSQSEQPARAAAEAGAEKIPEAALYLKLAREEIAAAKTMAAKDDDRAPLMLARARVDAELALAVAQDKTTTDEAQAALEQVRASQKE
jgi:hypothetical protein